MRGWKEGAAENEERGRNQKEYRGMKAVGGIEREDEDSRWKRKGKEGEHRERRWVEDDRGTRKRVRGESGRGGGLAKEEDSENERGRL